MEGELRLTLAPMSQRGSRLHTGEANTKCYSRAAEKLPKCPDQTPKNPRS